MSVLRILRVRGVILGCRILLIGGAIVWTRAARVARGFLRLTAILLVARIGGIRLPLAVGGIRLGGVVLVSLLGIRGLFC